MPDSVFDKLRAYKEKIDTPERVALFAAVGEEYYADAEYLNLLRGAILEIFDTGSGEFAQNNIVRSLNAGYVQYANIPPLGDVQNLVSERLNQMSFTISAEQIGVWQVILLGGPNGPQKYKYLFKPGLGKYGLQAKYVNYTDLEFFSMQNLLVADIGDDANTVVVALGILPNHTFLPALNSAEHTFNAPGKIYVVTYMIGAKTYMLYFIGNPGIYGGSGDPFTDNQFSELTDSDALPQLQYTSQLINNGDGTSKYARESQLDAAYNNSVKLNPSNADGQVISSGFLKILTSGIQALWGKITGNLDVTGNVSSDMAPTQAKHLTRMDWVLNKLTGKADLDTNGKVPLSQISDALLGNVKWKGITNGFIVVSSPEPELVNQEIPLPGEDNAGWYFICGSDFDRAGVPFKVGDWLISTGMQWEKVDNTDAVASVNGRTGVITLTFADVGAAAANGSNAVPFSNWPINAASANDAIKFGDAYGDFLNDGAGQTHAVGYDNVNNKVKRYTAGTFKLWLAIAMTDISGLTAAFANIGTLLSGKANDNNVIHKTGDETRLGLLSNYGILASVNTDKNWGVAIDPNTYDGGVNIQGVSADLGTVRNITMQGNGGFVNIGGGVPFFPLDVNGVIRANNAIVAGTGAGFQNESFNSGYNPIWNFRASPNYGMGYYQLNGADRIGHHFGDTASPSFWSRQDGVSYMKRGLVLGVYNENPSEKKIIEFNAGGYAVPGDFNADSNGDKILFYNGSDYDGRMGIGAAGNMWFKSYSTSGGGGYDFYTGSNAANRTLAFRITGNGRAKASQAPVDNDDVVRLQELSNAAVNVQNNYVPKIGPVTKTGTMTFADAPIVPTATLAGHPINKGQYDADMGQKVDYTYASNTFAYIIGDTLFKGNKAFENPPTVPVAGNPGHAVNLGQMNAAIAAAATPAVSIITASATLDFSATEINNSNDLTVSVPGASLGDVVALGVPHAAVRVASCYTAWVSATDQVTVRFNCYSTVSQNPASGAFKIKVFK